MDGYLKQRTQFRDISGSLDVTTTTDDTTLVTGRTGHTIYLQRIIFYVVTDAAQNMSFEDSNGTPKRVANIPASPGVDTRWEFDFGSHGVPLTEAKNFVMNVSAVGLAGRLVWEGYLFQTGVLSA